MDTENTNIGYLCGRLCAVIEKAHNLKNNQFGKVNMHTAAEQPLSFTPQFVALKNINNKQLDIMLTEILDKLDTDCIPNKLGVEEQGRFFIGYYHQKSYMGKSNLLVPVTITEEVHTPERINTSCISNKIDELRR